MRFAFSDEQEALRRSVRRVLDGHGHLRRIVDTAGDGDDPLWQRLGRELGLAGLIIPEEHGGAGLGWVELTAVMEELGRALACVPFFSTVGLGVNALLAAGGDAPRRYLPAIAGGQITATLAYLEPNVAHDGSNATWATTARRAGDQVILSGRKRHVVDGHRAGLLIVAARGESGVELYAVPGDAAGLRRERLPTMDLTRPLAEIVLDEVTVPAAARLDGADLDRVLACAAVALAAENVGGAQRCLDMAVDYAKVRTQFGRPIGSFQAVQHTCADMFVLVEAARSAAYYAGWAAANEPAELITVASIALASAADAFARCAGDAIQVHGGIGFTWEHDIHLYFKRARASRSLLGSPELHRERLACELLDRGAAESAEG